VNRQHGFWKTCDTEKLTRSRSEVCRHCRCTLYGARMRSYLNCMYRFQAARSITAPTVLVLHALVNPNAVWLLVHCVPLGERNSSPRFEQETFVWPTPQKTQPAQRLHRYRRLDACGDHHEASLDARSPCDLHTRETEVSFRFKRPKALDPTIGHVGQLYQRPVARCPYSSLARYNLHSANRNIPLEKPQVRTLSLEELSSVSLVAAKSNKRGSPSLSGPFY
jgi:hypothetical protein